MRRTIQAGFTRVVVIQIFKIFKFSCKEHCSWRPWKYAIINTQTSCCNHGNSTAVIVLFFILNSGVAGGGSHGQRGNAANYLCLPETPEYDYVRKGAQGNRGYLYGAEYETHEANGSPLQNLINYDVPCAVCDVSNRGRQLMIPAKMTCPDGWTKEYNGYLISEKHDHWRTSEYICMDHDPEAIPGSNANKDGALLYMVEGRCGSLQCASNKYVDGHELTCVVCTK